MPDETKPRAPGQSAAGAARAAAAFARRAEALRANLRRRKVQAAAKGDDETPKAPAGEKHN